MTITQVQVFMDGARLLEYRRNYHIASMTATVLNALGGKGDGKPMARHKQFTADEMLAPFANPYLTRLPRDAARDILMHVNRDYFPSWVVQLLPSEHEIKQAAST